VSGHSRAAAIPPPASQSRRNRLRDGEDFGRDDDARLVTFADLLDHSEDERRNRGYELVSRDAFGKRLLLPAGNGHDIGHANRWLDREARRNLSSRFAG
jgi:hypothetical protein